MRLINCVRKLCIFSTFCTWIVLISLPVMMFLQSTPVDYMPILIQIAVAVGFVVLALFLSAKLGPSRKTAKKEDNFECGIESQGDARFPVSVKYFLTAILFVLFDVEVIFFYPYAVNFREMGWGGFMAVLTFVALFLVGFIYVWRKGAFEWEK